MKNKRIIEKNLVLIAEVRDSYGELKSSCDFGSLGLHEDILTALLDSFNLNTGHLRVESRRQNWRCLRRFSYCLRELGLAEVKILPADTLQKYNRWLKSQNLKDSTRQSQQNIIVQHMEWIARNRRSILSKDFFKGKIPGFDRNEPNQLPSLLKEDVKKILAAAYKDIDKTIERISEGRRILAGYNLSSEEQALHKLMTDLLDHGNGFFPLQKELYGTGKDLARRVSKAGGLRNLRAMLFPNVTDIFGFYIAILAQTGGNPMAIHEMQRDSIRPDPLRQDRCSVVWDKHRSHSEQSVDFGLHRKRSAPNLILQVLALNELLVEFAEQSKKNRLFICMHANGHIAVGCYQLFHLELKEFIQRHDLPEFEPKQLRRTFGTLHEKAGGILVAKKKLNHKNISTTQTYTQNESTRYENDRLISRFQGELIEESKKGSAQIITAVRVKSMRSSGGGPYESIFGFICKDPMAGIAPGSTTGKLCSSFTSCSTCKGAIVPLDRPETVAKLIAAQNKLKELEKKSDVEGWRTRFEAVYRTTLIILENDLLGKVAPSVLSIAQKMNPAIFIPRLE